MNDEHNTTNEEQLISYLDGELPTDEAHLLETRLSDDPELRRRLNQHQQAWDLLDALPLTNVDDNFTRSTVEMVAVSASAEVNQQTEATSRGHRLKWWIAAEVLIAAALVGFIAVRLVVTAPNRQLVDDLRVLEELDAYRYAEDVEFLRALEREGLFGAEGADDL